MAPVNRPWYQSTARDERRTTRPPGTESMTGHIADGSIGGLCGDGNGGFHTTYLALVDCGNCLVMFDWAQESGLYDVVLGHVHVPGEPDVPPGRIHQPLYDYDGDYGGEDEGTGTGELELPEEFWDDEYGP